ncbi:hypothetical protein NGRA_2768 [Nosema granulosis]|uniref:Uncharacterized protein n=1 Tax=Nosema granulosis TaxID=83296 RepID=A0A9P6KXV8_9MICR|nr:hypothetical protein NGRA_2768 [Nosema granulosis]
MKCKTILICIFVLCIIVGIFILVFYIESFSKIFENDDTNACALNLKDVKQITCRFKEYDIMEIRDIKDIQSNPESVTPIEIIYIIFATGFIVTEVLHNEEYRKKIFKIIAIINDTKKDGYLTRLIKYFFANFSFMKNIKVLGTKL